MSTIPFCQLTYELLWYHTYQCNKVEGIIRVVLANHKRRLKIHSFLKHLKWLCCFDSPEMMKAPVPTGSVQKTAPMANCRSPFSKLVSE